MTQEYQKAYTGKLGGISGNLWGNEILSYLTKRDVLYLRLVNKRFYVFMTNSAIKHYIQWMNNQILDLNKSLLPEAEEKITIAKEVVELAKIQLQALGGRHM